MILRIIAASCASFALVGCTSLQSNPEIKFLPEVGVRPNVALGASAPVGAERFLPGSFVNAGQTDAGKRVGDELQRVAVGANVYLATAKQLATEDRGANALLLGGGFYGAAVTAFNPAPKNLLAALLGSGTAQAWRGQLKPAERARVYVQGYRALDCVHSAGSALLADTDAGNATGLRNEIRKWSVVADQLARDERVKPDASQAKDSLKLLGELMVEVDRLNATLKMEEASIVDAPYRVGRVRREVEAAVDRRLAAAAPDFAAALRLLSEAAKPSGGPPQRGGDGQKIFAATPPNDLTAFVGALSGRVGDWKADAPTRASDAYERMGKCIELVG